MRKHCVPGAPSDFSSAWERGYNYVSIEIVNLMHTINVLLMLCGCARFHVSFVCAWLHIRNNHQ